MFAPGETEVQVMIPLMDDDVEECDEEFFGQLSIPEGAAAMGVKASDAATATVTIDDNDSKYTYIFCRVIVRVGMHVSIIERADNAGELTYICVILSL